MKVQFHLVVCISVGCGPGGCFS